MDVSEFLTDLLGILTDPSKFQQLFFYFTEYLLEFLQTSSEFTLRSA